MPTNWSPTMATTAGWPDFAADRTSETGNTGWGSSGARLWSADGDGFVEVVLVEIA